MDDHVHPGFSFRFSQEVHAVLRGRLPLDLPELPQHGRARRGAAPLVELGGAHPGAAAAGAAGRRHGGGAADGGRAVEEVMGTHGTHVDHFLGIYISHI